MPGDNPANTLEFTLGRMQERLDTICTKLDRHDEDQKKTIEEIRVEQKKTIEEIRVEQKKTMEVACGRITALEQFRDGIKIRVGLIGGAVAFMVANAEPVWTFVKKLFAAKGTP